MKLILIYGPPAAGKLTVANEIAKRTGFKVFHNHLSIDYVRSVFEFGGPAFWRVIERVRFPIIAEAARQNIDLIHTFCYEFGSDDEHVARLISSAEDNGGEVRLVLLHCSDEERRKRIGSESRVRIGKLTDPESVGRSAPVLTSPYPGRDTLILDTTDAPAAETAERIIEYFRLQQNTGS